MKSLTDKINQLQKCKESFDFCSGKTAEEMYQKCEKGEWILWAYSSLYPNDIKLITLVKGYIANSVRHLITNKICLNVIDTCIAFGEGKATLPQLQMAHAAVLHTTNAPDGVAHHASYTIPDFAKQNQQNMQAAIEFYAYHSFLTAHCAANSFHSVEEKTKHQKLTADIVRKYIILEKNI